MKTLMTRALIAAALSLAAFAVSAQEPAKLTPEQENAVLRVRLGVAIARLSESEQRIIALAADVELAAAELRKMQEAAKTAKAPEKK